MTRLVAHSDATKLPADTVGGLIARRIGASPDASAIVDGERPALTFAALGDTIELAVRRLEGAGIGREDRVAVVLPDGAATATACLAVSTRACCVPLDPRLREGELEDRFRRIGVRAVVLPRGASAARVVAERLALRTLELLELPEGAPGRFELLVEPAPPAPERPGRVDLPGPDHPAFVLLTSGSTATPKAVPLTHGNVTASARNVARSLALGPGDRGLSTLPLFHVGGLVDLLLAPWAAGGSVAFAPALAAARFGEALERHRPTWYQAVPTMLHAILEGTAENGGGTRAHGLRFIRSVSSPLPEPLRLKVEERWGVPVIEIYGMSETAGVITSNPLPPGERRPGSVGLPAGNEIAIVDAEGKRCAAGVSGEVLVRGESVMSGYEGAEVEPPFLDGWLRTGDLGHVDEDGYLYLSGRIEEIIDRGGEKVSPAEVDRALLEHAAVLDAAAFPVPHETLGEEVAAAVVVRPGSALDEADLLRSLSERLAYYKVPRRIVTVDALPRGPGGKLVRRALTERFGTPGPEARWRAYEAPPTPLGRLLAETWQDVLRVSQVGVHDDFFDLGGDSLRAVELFVALEERTGLRADVSTIFDAPTIAALEPLLAAQLAAREAPSSPVAAPRSRRAMVDDWIETQMAGWSGVRASPSALIVGRNTLGGKRPLFWCVQVAAELDELQKHLDADRPLYGMRSLFRLPGGKDATDNEALATRYTDDVLAVQPAGPYLIGGYCEGGKIAFRVAKRLRALGHTVQLLALQEQFVAEPYDGAVAMFLGGVGDFSPYRYYSSPELGWPKLYTGPLRVHRSAIPHHDFYRPSNARAFAAELERTLDWAESGARGTAAGSRLQVLPAGAYRARLRVDAPWVLRPGQPCTVPVRVRNVGDVTWLPTELSGVTVANRWLGLGGSVHVWLDGTAPLTGALEPGETTTVELEVRAPERGGAWRLEVDVVDQGVAWFQERGSRPVRATLAVIPALERAAT